MLQLAALGYLKFIVTLGTMLIAATTIAIFITPRIYKKFNL